LASIAEVCQAAKKKIVPPPRLKRLVQSRAEEIRTKVEHQCVAGGLAAEVRLDGSVAKDTWVRGHADVDIFMRVSPELTKAQLRNVCLPIARRALWPNDVVERYAEHPYVEAEIPLETPGTLRVNVVPCYNVEKGNWLSATDRSPYHTEYIRQHLSNPQRDEVRLLKAFMRGIGSYGADIKTGGFSGMLCETLIVSRGGIQRVVQDFRQWDGKEFVDVENYYKGRGDEVKRIFKEPLVVIDPVDKGRNLAAAVREEQLWNFVAACRQFTAKPSTPLFAEPKVKPLTATDFQKLLRVRRSALLCLNLGRIDAVVDILWSQLYRTQRAIVSLLKSNEFKIIRSMAWSDEKSLSIILFELEEGELASAKWREGPPVARLKESGLFLRKHSGSANTLSGPWIENVRWVVLKRRPIVSARALLIATLRLGGKDIGIAALPAKSLRKQVRLLEGDQIGRLVASNREFAKVMRTYLSGRPAWLA
jgi:tRNA nucleotidyltransferase (CCA-adding enzyme)